MNIIVTVDGSSIAHHVHVGGVIRDAKTNVVISTLSRPFGRGTSNEAEYFALIAGCQEARRLKATGVLIYTDSQLVVQQLRGAFRIKNKRLLRLHDWARRELCAIRAKVMWHSREDGDGPAADALTKPKEGGVTWKSSLGGPGRTWRKNSERSWRGAVIASKSHHLGPMEASGPPSAGPGDPALVSK